MSDDTLTAAAEANVAQMGDDAVNAVEAAIAKRKAAAAAAAAEAAKANAQPAPKLGNMSNAELREHCLKTHGYVPRV